MLKKQFKFASLALAGLMSLSVFGGMDTAQALEKKESYNELKAEKKTANQEFNNEYIITFDMDSKKLNKVLDNKIVKQYISESQGNIIKEGTELNYVLVKLPNSKIADKLSKKKGIKSVTPNVVETYNPTSIPSGWNIKDPYTSEATSWGYDQVIGEMHSKGINATGKGVEVLVMDVGATDEHPDTKFEDIDLSSYSTNEDTFEDPGLGNHAMGVAGIIGASKNNFGTIGIAPDSRLFYFQVGNLTSEGVHISAFDTIRGLEYALANGIDIVNMSYGSRRHAPALQNLITEADAKGLIMVGAAGNDGMYNDPSDNDEPYFPDGHYPSDYNGVISVSALKENNQLAGYSNYGDIDFAGPTDSVSSDNPYVSGDYYTSYFNGTSAASPFVAGVIALYKEIYPDYNKARLLELVYSDAKDVGLNFDQQGNGRISAPSYDTGVREDDLTHGHALYTANGGTSVKVGGSYKMYARLMDDPETVAYKPGQHVRGVTKPFEGATIRHEVVNSSGVVTYTSATTTGMNGRYDLTVPGSAFAKAGVYTVYTRYSFTDPVTGQKIYSYKSAKVTAK